MFLARSVLLVNKSLSLDYVAYHYAQNAERMEVAAKMPNHHCDHCKSINSLFKVL